jgi:glutamate transport system substrate-binding protein
LNGPAEDGAKFLSKNKKEERAMKKSFNFVTAVCMAVAMIWGGAAVAANAGDFPAGSKMAELAASGKIRVGVQTQYPLIGMKALTGYDGFDVRIAGLIASRLGISQKNVEFVPVATPTREPFLQQQKVDMVIAAYTITPERSEVIDFAGPYLLSASGIMVKVGNPLAIKSLDDMVGKHLCAVTGTNQEIYISNNFPDVRKTMVLFDSSAKCAQAVINGQADASTTDQAILASFAKQNDRQLEVIDYSYGSSPWGIGLKKSNDKTFCKWINKTLGELFADGSWAQSYDTTIGTVVPGGAPKPPVIETSCTVGG